MQTAADRSSVSTRARTIGVRLVQVAVTLAAFAYLYMHVDRAALVDAYLRISVARLAAVVAIHYLAYAFAVVRWRLLLSAFGASAPPPLWRLTKYYLIGAFYNTYLPGGVGGDVVRGLASRDAFGSTGAASALAVVLVERVLGLSAMLLLTAAATFVDPLPGIIAPWLLACLGSAAALGSVVGLLLARRLSLSMPAPFDRWLAKLPVPSRVWPLLGALTLSVACQLLPALAGHALLSALGPAPRLTASLAIVPIATAAAFLPFTLSGAGVREAIFVNLFALVGVAAGPALVASLALWLSQAVVAASGGLWALLRPLGATRPPS